MSGAARRRCCCGSAPDDCSGCGGCPTAVLGTWSASLRYESGSVFWEWSYSGASVGLTRSGGGGCGYYQSDAADGTMEWEVSEWDPSDPCFGSSLSGSCAASAADPDLSPLLSLSCEVSFLFPALVSALGVATPTFWSIGIQPVPRKDPIFSADVCACSPFWSAGWPVTKLEYGLSLIYDRSTACATALGTFRGLAVLSADGLSIVYIPGGGSATAGSFTITASGSASFT